MGKKIDRFVLTVIAMAGFYFFYQQAFHMRALSLMLSIISSLVLRKLVRSILNLLNQSRIFRRKRMRKCACGAMMRLACLPDSEAQMEMETLVRKIYKGDYAVAVIQAHPSEKLNTQSLFELWKSHYQKQERLVICATCAADTDCRLLACSLKAPRVALLDSAALVQLMAEHPEGMCADEAPSPRARLRQRMRHASYLLINRKNAPRGFVFSISMLALYLLSGKIWYLISALFLLFLVLASLRKASRPVRLF